MPVTLYTGGNAPEELGDDVFEAMFDENGPILEAEVIAAFLEDVDFDDVMDDEEVQEHIELEDGYYILGEDGDLTECKEEDEGAQLLVIETLDGEILVQAIDEDDLFAMFQHYVQNLSEESLEAKMRKAVFSAIIDEEEPEGGVDEAKGPFKKGSFRKIHKAGGATQVNRMLGAMMNKVSIKRAKAPGKGYKKGDYTKAAGYAPGTGSGIKKWKAYKSKKAADLAKQAKKAKKGAKIAGKKAGYKAAPKKKGAKQLKKKAKAGAKKKLSASEETPNKGTRLNESTRLAAGMLKKFGGAPLPAAKKDGEDK